MTTPASPRLRSASIALALLGFLLALSVRPAAAGSRVPPPGMRLQWKIRLNMTCASGRATLTPPEQYDDAIAVGPIVKEGPRETLVNFLGRSNEPYANRPKRIRIEGNRVFLREDSDQPEVLLGTFSQQALDDACAASESGRYASGDFDLTFDPAVKVKLTRSGGSSLCLEKFAVGTTSRNFVYDLVLRDPTGQEVHLEADHQVIFRQKADCQDWKESWVSDSSRSEGDASFFGLEN